MSTYQSCQSIGLPVADPGGFEHLRRGVAEAALAALVLAARVYRAGLCRGHSHKITL